MAQTKPAPKPSASSGAFTLTTAWAAVVLALVAWAVDAPLRRWIGSRRPIAAARGQAAGGVGGGVGVGVTAVG